MGKTADSYKDVYICIAQVTNMALHIFRFPFRVLVTPIENDRIQPEPLIGGDMGLMESS